MGAAHGLQSDKMCLLQMQHKALCSIWYNSALFYIPLYILIPKEGNKEGSYSVLNRKANLSVVQTQMKLT